MQLARLTCVILSACLGVASSAAQTVTLNFASASGACVDASAYLKSFGITFVATTSGATVHMCGPQPPSIPSGFFFIGPPVTNTPVSGDLVFSSPVSNITIVTDAVDPATSTPGWDAKAYNASGVQLSTVGEGALFPGPGSISLSMNVSGVARLHFDAFNTGGNTYNFPPIGLITFTRTSTSAPPPIAYATGFEENALYAPFWTVTDQYGVVSLSKDVAYDGSHSVKLQSASGGQRQVSIQHNFSTLTKGTVSVAFYDAAPGQETLYEQLNVYNSRNASFAASVGTMDFDANCYEASLSVDGVGSGPNALCGSYPQMTTTPVKRTIGWHIFTIAVDTSSMQIAIDGQTVFVATGAYQFDTIRLEATGPSWRPNTAAYFDSFSYTPLTY